MKPQLEQLERRDTPATLSISDAVVLEGNAGLTQLQYTVQLSEPLATQASVQVSTSPGSATPGSDYRPTSSTLVFAPGETAKTFSVNVLGDTVGEADETVRALLRNARGASIADGQAIGAITNDDATHGASISLAGGVLSITGTEFADGVDGVTVQQVGGVLYVGMFTRDGSTLVYQQQFSAPLADVQRIEFFGLDGDDVFTDYSSVFSFADGGAGDNLLLADEVLA